MKKLILFSCLSLLAAWQVRAQDYTLTRGIPGIIFGYPSDVPLIDDQARVATVVWPNLSEITYMGEYKLLAIDGARIPGRVRSSPFRRHETAYFAVDLLPGRHTLSVSYSEYLPLAGTGRRTYKVSTPAPVDVAVEVEAGNVYQLRALLSQGAFAEFSVDRGLTDPTIVGRMAGAAIDYDVYLGDGVVYRARNNSKTTIQLTGAGAAALWAKTESRADLPLDIEPEREYWVRCGMRMGALVGRPVLEIVDATTGRAEFEKIPLNRQDPSPAAPISIGTPAVTPTPTVPVAPAAPEPAPASVEVVEALSPPASPVPEAVKAPVPIPAGIGNGTLEILAVAPADAVMFRPAAGVEIPSGELNVRFVSGAEGFSPEFLNAGGKIGFAFDGGFIYRDYSCVIAKLSGAPAGFRSQQIVFTVAGKEMTFDIARSAWVEASEKPVPAAWEALSSGWEGENFTAAFELNGPNTGYAHGIWQFDIKPPFPHTITGLDDSYVQTAVGILLMRIAYANTSEVKNAAEAERWFRRTVELGIAEAETKLNELLAGRSVGSSFGYNFGFKRLP